MTTNKLARAVSAVALLAVWGCQTLDVTNPNNPDAKRALSDPAAVEALGSGAIQSWFNAYTDLRGAGVTNVQARTFSSSWNNGNLNYHQGVYLADGSRMDPFDTVTSPTAWTRNGAPYANDPAAAARTTIESFWGGGLDESATQRPGMYAVLSSANAVLKAIRINHLLINDSASTLRDEATAQFMQGAALMVLALQYDKAYVVDENTDVQTVQYSTRDIVRDSAVSKLTQAAALFTAGSSNGMASLEADWTNGGEAYTPDEMAKIAYTMAAMTIAWYPRDSTEAAAADWNTVKTYAAQGLTYTGCHNPVAGGSFPKAVTCPGDWAAVGDGYNGWVSELMAWFDAMDTGRLHTRVAHLMDPATQIDPYRLGIGSPQPNSPDARLGDGTFGTSNLGSSYNNVALDAGGGTDFAWLGTAEIFRASRGFYVHSNIGHSRYDASGNQLTTDVYGAYGAMPAVSWEIGELLQAEADLRLADPVNAALHINTTRVNRGGLTPAAGAAGVPGDGPCMTNNKLAKDGSVCTLWSQLNYEYELELLGLGPAPYWHQRGMPNVIATNWEEIGTGIYNGPRYVQGLLPGTPREMPVPAKELGVKSEALYTWGGTGPANSPTP